MLLDHQNYVIEVSSGMFKKEKEKAKQRWKAMNACGKDEKKKLAAKGKSIDCFFLQSW